MFVWRLALVLLVALAASLPSRLDAQLSRPAPVRVKYAVTCAQCRIELTKVATLGSPGDPVPIGGAAGVERDRQGRFYAISLDRSQVVLFDAIGKFLRTVGKTGEANGEFGGVGVLYLRIGTGDTLFVFHSINRVDVFSPALTFVRRMTMPTSTRLNPYVLRDGRFVVAASYVSRGVILPSYHLLDKSGVTIRSIGDSVRASDPNAAPPIPAAFILSPDEKSFWTSNEYLLQQRNLDGTRGAAFFVHDIPWFKAATVAETFGRGGRAMNTAKDFTTVGLAGVDSTGLIWLNGLTHTSVPSAGGRATEQNSYRIDVFDSRTGKVLVSQPIEHNGLRFLTRSNLAYSASTSASGMLSYTVWRVALRGR